MENQNNESYPFISKPGADPAVPYQRPVFVPPNTFARAAMILGIIALVLCFTFTIYPAMILGALSIILALLSKGKEPRMHSNAKTGVITGIAALCLDLVLVVGSFYMVFSNSSYHEQFNELYEDMYGQSFDDMMEGLKNGTLDYNNLY